MTRLPTTIAASALLTTALAVAGSTTAGAVATPTNATAAASAGGSVSAWVTTPDRTEEMHRRPDVAFHDGGSARTTITVDPRTTSQTMSGFGAALTGSSATLLAGMAPAARNRAMRRLFDPSSGIGVSFLRQPFGSSDFVAGPHYTYDDVPAGQTDFALQHFTIAPDEAQILPLLRRAKALNPALEVMATPWSPPAWMKDGDSLVGGRLKDDPRIYRTYAAYLTKAVLAYTAAGVPIDLVSVQNEPQNRAPKAYPGTDMPVEQEAAVISWLGPMLSRVSPQTKIVGYDHNWATHPDDVATTPPGEDPETDYPYELLRSPAATWVDGIGFHCYYGDPSAQTALHDAFPDKEIWFTECSGSHGPDDAPADIFRGGLTWHARNIVIGTTRNWAESVATWNVALDPQGGPHDGGCDTCTGLVTIAADGTVTPNAEFFTIGHLAKFVKKGAVRIGSTSFGTTGWNGQLIDVAFRNPDGSTALVVHNENDAPRSFTVAVGDRSFDYDLPGGALATFTWQGLGGAAHLPRAASLERATATASPGADDAAYAIDGDGSTRWSTGTAQEPGQHLDVDLGALQFVRRVDLDSGDNLGDYARGWRLSVSRDGTTWRDVASGTGVGQLTRIDVPPTLARWVRVTSTASSGSWWSVADLRVSV